MRGTRAVVRGSSSLGPSHSRRRRSGAPSSTASSRSTSSRSGSNPESLVFMPTVSSRGRMITAPVTICHGSHPSTLRRPASAPRPPSCTPDFMTSTLKASSRAMERCFTSTIKMGRRSATRLALRSSTPARLIWSRLPRGTTMVRGRSSSPPSSESMTAYWACTISRVRQRVPRTMLWCRGCTMVADGMRACA